MRKKETIAVLDMGTTKFVTLIATVGPDGVPSIRGIGIENSAGMTSGIITNMREAIEAVRRSVQMAQTMSGINAESLLVGLTGKHVTSIQGTGHLKLSSDLNAIAEVTTLAVENALDQATTAEGEFHMTHRIPRGFRIDGVVRENPIGLTGNRLEADVLMINSPGNIVSNVQNCIHDAGFRVEGLVLESLAASFSVLLPGERKAGTLLIDMGGGTSDVALYHGGHLQYVHVLPYSGNRVTRDLAELLGTSLEHAEELKVAHGRVGARMVSVDHRIKVPLMNSNTTKEYPLSHVAEIIGSRLEEYFMMIHRDLEQSNFLDMIASGVVLTGGGSQLPGALELASQVFNQQARLGTPVNLPDIQDKLNNPRFTVATGLVLYDAIRRNLLREELIRPIGNLHLLQGMDQGINRVKGRPRNLFGRLFGRLAGVL